MSKATIPHVLFEPASVRWLGPLIETRAVWDLRVGPRSPRELLAGGLGDGELSGFWARSELVPLYPRPPVKLFGGGSVLLIAGHQLLLAGGWREQLAELSDGETLESGGETLALRLPGPQALEFLESLDFAAAEPGPAGETAQEGPLGPLLRFWWEIYELAPRVLQAMLPELTGGGAWRSPRRREWTGRGDVHLAAGAETASGVIIDATAGPVALDRDVRIGAGAFLQGPCYLGPGTRVKPLSLLLHGCFSGPQCRIGGEVEEAQFQGFANKQHHGFLGHAALGEWVNLGAGVTNSDLKNNYSPVRVTVQGRELPTGRLFVGSCLGDHVKVGIQGRLNTGTVFEPFCNWFGAGFPPKYLPAYTWGGDDGFGEYRLDRALETAAAVMERRGRSLGAGEEAVYQGIFERAAEGRPG